MIFSSAGYACSENPAHPTFGFPERVSICGKERKSRRAHLGSPISVRNIRIGGYYGQN